MPPARWKDLYVCAAGKVNPKEDQGLKGGKINNELGVSGVLGTSADARRPSSCDGTRITDGKVNQTVSSGTSITTSRYTTRSKSKPPSLIARHDSTPNITTISVHVLPEKKSYLGLYNNRKQLSAQTNKSSPASCWEIANTPNSPKTTSQTVSDITQAKPVLARIEDSNSINSDSHINKPNNIIEYNKTQASVYRSVKKQSSYLDLYSKRKQLTANASKSTYSDPKLSNDTTLPPIIHNTPIGPENETKTTESCRLISDSWDSKPPLSDDTNNQPPYSDNLPALSDIRIHLPILTAHARILDRSNFADTANKHIGVDTANPTSVVSDNATMLSVSSNTALVSDNAITGSVSDNANKPAGVSDDIVKPMVSDIAMNCEFVSNKVNNTIDPENAEMPIVFDNATKVSIASDNVVNNTGDSIRESRNIKLESERQPEPNPHSTMDNQNETDHTPKSTSSKPVLRSKPVREKTSVIKPRSVSRSSSHAPVNHSKYQTPKSTSSKSTAQSKPGSENTSVIKPPSVSRSNPHASVSHSKYQTPKSTSSKPTAQSSKEESKPVRENTSVIKSRIESRSSTPTHVSHTRSVSRSKHTSKVVSQCGPTTEMGTESKQTRATKPQSSTIAGSARKPANKTNPANTQISESKSNITSKLTPSKPKPYVDFIKKNIANTANKSETKADKKKEKKTKQEPSSTKSTHKSKSIEKVKKQYSKLPKLAVKHTKKSTQQLANIMYPDNESNLPPVLHSRCPSNELLPNSQQTVNSDTESIKSPDVDSLKTINTTPEPIIKDMAITISNKQRSVSHVVASNIRPTSANETETTVEDQTPIGIPSTPTLLWSSNSIQNAYMVSNSEEEFDTPKGICDVSPDQFRRIIQPPESTVARPPGATYLEARYNEATDVVTHMPTMQTTRDASADTKTPHPPSQPAPQMSRSRQLRHRHVVRPCGQESTTQDTHARIQLSSSDDDTEDEESARCEEHLPTVVRDYRTPEPVEQFDIAKADHHAPVESISESSEQEGEHQPKSSPPKHLRQPQLEGVNSTPYGKLPTIGYSLDMSPCPPYRIKLPPVQGVKMTIHMQAIKPTPSTVWKTEGGPSLDKTVLPSIGLATTAYSYIAKTMELCAREGTPECYMDTSDYNYSEESDSDLESAPQRHNSWTTTISAESSRTDQITHMEGQESQMSTN